MAEGEGNTGEYRPHSKRNISGVLAVPDEADGCKGQCQMTMPWDGKFVVQPDGTTEEHWEFEVDTYTIGLLAMVQKGLPQGAGELGLALVTPVIQLLAFFRIFEYLTSKSTEEVDVEDSRSSCNPTVQFICFLLMALQVSNEALEGLHKLIFSFRAFGGKYKDVKTCSGIGILLGFSQCMMAIATVGLSMLVVSEQQTALDAFMNFVAVAFLTEVDNILVSARTVTGLVATDNTITVQHVLPAEVEHASPHHWPTKALLVVNVLVVASLLVALQIQWIVMGIAEEQHKAHEHAAAEDEQHGAHERVDNDLWRRIPPVILVLLLLNTAMYVGNRIGASIKYFMLMGYACLAIGALDMAHLYSTNTRLLPVMASQAIQTFALMGPSCAGAILFNPFPFMMCPVKSPSLVWASLVHTVFCFESLHRFGLESFTHATF